MKKAVRSEPQGAKCGAQTRAGHPCKKPAGFKTDHPGVGRCNNHGGSTPIKHGLYSPTWKQLFKHRTGEWDKAAARSGDLLEEIAVLRAMAEHVSTNKKGMDVDAFLKVVDRIIKAVSAQQQMEREGMVTKEQFHRYMQAVGLVLLKEIKDKDALRRIETNVEAIPVLAG